MGLSHERDRLLSCPVGVEATAPNKDHPGGSIRGKERRRRISKWCDCSLQRATFKEMF